MESLDCRFMFCSIFAGIWARFEQSDFGFCGIRSTQFRIQCIVNTFASHGSGDSYEGIEIMAWDPKEKVYRDHSLWFDSPDQWSYAGHFEGEVLIYRAEFDYLGKHVRSRSEMRPQPGGGFALDEFASVNGGPEEALLHGRATPH
jgi:hypothetical protein